MPANTAQTIACTMEDIRNMFSSWNEYQEALQQMTLKERMRNWQPTNSFEKSLQQAIGKQKKFSPRVTSYVVSDSDNGILVYISHGAPNARKRLTRHGFVYDRGGFVNFTSTEDGVDANFQSPYEYYKLRYIIEALLFSLLFLIPGVIIASITYFTHRTEINNFDKRIYPALRKTFEQSDI